MKPLIYIITLLCIPTIMSANGIRLEAKPGCEMASTYGELAYLSFKKAYQASSIENAMPLLKDGVLKADEAAAFAISPSCNCANAKNYALNGVTFGNKAMKETDLARLKKGAKKAMDMALDVLTATPNCGK